MSYEQSREMELVESRTSQVLSPSPNHQEISSRILFALKQYLQSGQIRGLAYQSLDFALTERHRMRPDVCIFLKERADYLDRDRVPVPIAPDIAIEVISPLDDPSDHKVANYLRNGVSEVWRVFAKNRSAEVDCGDESRGEKDTLTSALLPGFALRISSLFE
jgi:Uma2 family endonuclease